MAFHLPRVERLIALVRSSEAGQSVKVLVGGYPFNVDPELWLRVGADGHARDAHEALGVADRLLNLPEPGERKARETYAAEVLAGVVGRQEARQPPAEVAVYDELSRLLRGVSESMRWFNHVIGRHHEHRRVGVVLQDQHRREANTGRSVPLGRLADNRRSRQLRQLAGRCLHELMVGDHKHPLGRHKPIQPIHRLPQ